MNVTELNVFSDKMYVELDVLRALVVDRVGGHVDRGETLSQNTNVACLMLQSSSSSSWCSQMHSATVLATPRYSALALEWDTIGCHLENHETRASPRNMQKPEVE